MIYDEFREPWMPTLMELEYLKEHGTQEEQEYYSQFGWDQLVVSAECPAITAKWSNLETRFMERYGARLLNTETLERWQVRLQNKLDEIQFRYERAYRLYTEYAEDMDNDILESEVTQVNATNQASGMDSTTGNSSTKNIDTPDSAINDDDDYADSLSKSQSGGSTTYGRKDTMGSTTTREMHGNSVIDNIHASIDKYRDIDTEFVKEFENLFLNVFWY